MISNKFLACLFVLSTVVCSGQILSTNLSDYQKLDGSLCQNEQGNFIYLKIDSLVQKSDAGRYYFADKCDSNIVYLVDKSFNDIGHYTLRLYSKKQLTVLQKRKGIGKAIGRCYIFDNEKSIELYINYHTQTSAVGYSELLNKNKYEYYSTENNDFIVVSKRKALKEKMKMVLVEFSEAYPGVFCLD